MNKGLELERALLASDDLAIQAIIARHEKRKDNDRLERQILGGILRDPKYQGPAPETDFTIAATIIVKNEIKTIASCLMSIGRFVNEILVMDTGSTDETVLEVSEMMHLVGTKTKLAQVAYDEWSFSVARNDVKINASTDFIFMIDGHEIMTAPEKYPDLKDDTLYYVNLKDVDDDFNLLSDGYTPRIFPNKPEFYYEGAIQNRLIVPEWTKEELLDIDVYHFTPPKVREERTENVLKGYKIIDFNSLQRYFNLCVMSGRWKEIIFAYNAHMGMCDITKCDPDIFMPLAYAHFSLGSYRNALVFLGEHAGLKEDPDLNNKYATFACRYALGEWDEALAAANDYLHWADQPPGKTIRESIRHKLYVQLVQELLTYHIRQSL